jgi:hypothetical protein
MLQKMKYDNTLEEIFIAHLILPIWSVCAVPDLYIKKMFTYTAFGEKIYPREFCLTNFLAFLNRD